MIAVSQKPFVCMSKPSETDMLAYLLYKYSFTVFLKFSSIVSNAKISNISPCIKVGGVAVLVRKFPPIYKSKVFVALTFGICKELVMPLFTYE